MKQRSLDRIEKLLYFRNILVGIAALLFVLSIIPLENLVVLRALLRAAAYFLGAGAYLSEIAVLTDGFKAKVPLKVMFMPYVLFAVYIMMGIAYLADHLEAL